MENKDNPLLGKYVIIRSSPAGVFAGTLDNNDGNTVMLTGARRIWYWAGAATLSQLAVAGTSKPSECKFPVKVPMIKIFEVCEIIEATEKGKESIESVPIWSE